MGKHCSNQRCFKEKKLNCQLAQYEKNKFDTNIFEKKKCGEILQQGKNYVEKTVTIYSVLNNYKAKFPISLI